MASFQDRCKLVVSADIWRASSACARMKKVIHCYVQHRECLLRVSVYSLHVLHYTEGMLAVHAGLWLQQVPTMAPSLQLSRHKV